MSRYINLAIPCPAHNNAQLQCSPNWLHHERCTIAIAQLSYSFLDNADFPLRPRDPRRFQRGRLSLNLVGQYMNPTARSYSSAVRPLVGGALELELGVMESGRILQNLNICQTLSKSMSRFEDFVETRRILENRWESFGRFENH